MSRPDEQRVGQFGIGDVASLLGVTVTDLPGNERQLDILVELTEALLEKNGEKWIMQHGGVILDQWEAMLTSGI